MTLLCAIGNDEIINNTGERTGLILYFLTGTGESNNKNKLPFDSAAKIAKIR